MKKCYGLVLICFFLSSVLCSCKGNPDADMLMREALTNVGSIKSCNADYKTELEFHAGGTPNHFIWKNESFYISDPFALKSVQSTSVSGSEKQQTTYTVFKDGANWFYTNIGGNWQKTAAQPMDTAPMEQIDILRVLKEVKAQKFMREEKVDGTAVYKLELEFNSKILRSPVENIVTASGIGKGSRTIINTLLESAPCVYGYCYITKDTGRILRVELDASQPLKQIFENITGENVKIEISKYVVSGNINKIDSVSVKLPPEADNAKTVQAAG